MTVKDLEEVYAVTARARDNVRSMGVAVSAGSLPETGGTQGPTQSREPCGQLAEQTLRIGTRRPQAPIARVSGSGIGVLGRF